MSDVAIVAGSTGPSLRFQVVEGEEDIPVDLTGKTVRLRFAAYGQTAKWERDCTIDVAAEGRCHLEWEEDDLATSGSYEAQVLVDYGGGLVRLSEPMTIDLTRYIPAPDGA